MVASGRNVQALCVTGSPVPDQFELPPRCDLIKLPSIGKNDVGHYVPRRMASGLREVTELRSNLIATTLRSYRPDLFLVDHTVLGPGEELLPVLQRLRHEYQGTRIVLGMRDVLDSPMRARAELRKRGAFDAIMSFYDHVLVYGDRTVFDPIHEYGFPAAVAERTLFVGPVVPSTSGPRVKPAASVPHLLVTAGGGEDGFELIRSVIAALRGPMRDAALTATIVAGPLLGAEAFADLRRAVGGDERLTLLRSTSAMSEQQDRADLVIGMGGYNTVYETLARGLRLLAAPRRHPREEQWERCRRLADRGLMTMFDEGVLGDPHRTAAAIRAALAAPLPSAPLQCGGADAAARICLRLAGTPRSQSSPFISSL